MGQSVPVVVGWHWLGVIRGQSGGSWRRLADSSSSVGLVCDPDLHKRSRRIRTSDVPEALSEAVSNNESEAETCSASTLVPSQSDAKLVVLDKIRFYGVKMVKKGSVFHVLALVGHGLIYNQVLVVSVGLSVQSPDSWRPLCQRIHGVRCGNIVRCPRC